LERLPPWYDPINGYRMRQACGSCLRELGAGPVPEAAGGRSLEFVQSTEGEWLSAAPQSKPSTAADTARRQALHRDVNEQIQRLSDSFEDGAELELVCECGNCSFERIALSHDDYEAIRRFPTRFVVKPGHLDGDGDRIVAEISGGLIVEKVGSGAETAIVLDPRRRKR
jgi:hypothetical protein